MADIMWKPSKDLVEAANVTRFMEKHNIQGHDQLLRRSREDPEWFWPAIVEDLGIEWFKEPEAVLDLSEGKPWARWFPGGRVNMAHNGLDRHARGPLREKVLCIWESDDGEVRRTTYGHHHEEANRLAHALGAAGVEPGDTVGLYMPMVPEVLSAIFACWKVGAIAVPIFSGFAAGATATRLRDAGAKVLFTADGYTRRGKVVRLKEEADEAVAAAPSVERVVVLRRLERDAPWDSTRDVPWEDFLAGHPADFDTRPLDSEHPSMILYTSGTTGRPKGAVHTHQIGRAHV